MLDRYGRNITYLRLSVTELCNLRCRYCMPEEGVCKKEHSEMLTEEEIVLAVETAAELGINKLRITGGEPLVKKNIVSICERTAAVPGIREVCITTNGVLLPKLARPLKDAGVRRLNISLDTLDAAKFRYITRLGSLDEVLRGVETALETGFEKIKLNAVRESVDGKRVIMIDDSIVRGTTSARIVRLLREAGAKEVHVRISSPPFLHTCHFGTDIDSEENLIAGKCSSTEEIAKYIGADSLGYLPVECLGELVDNRFGYCKGCFTGDYPVDISGAGSKNKFDEKIHR